jgi:hypothetical protein
MHQGMSVLQQHWQKNELGIHIAIPLNLKAQR